MKLRDRFEIFKRDNFTCQYCGKRSPEVVLEVDHIIPVVEGGTDDTVNLTTSCFECNRGKAGISLNEIRTGEDTHDAAIEILERRRQLEEYNEVLRADREIRNKTAWKLCCYWFRLTGRELSDSDRSWVASALRYCPEEKLREFFEFAVVREKVQGLAFVNACVQGWRQKREVE